MTNPTPAANVITAPVLAFIGGVDLAIVDDGVPADLNGWIVLVAKAVGLSGLVGAGGYAKTETNPSTSELRNR